jgi:hypothetical protein
MRWERRLTTGGSLVMSGHQVVLSHPSPQGQVVEDVSWWSNEQISRYLSTYGLGGFDRSGDDGARLAERMQGRTPLPWATIHLVAPAPVGSVATQFSELLAHGPSAWRSRWCVECTGASSIDLCLDDAAVADVRETGKGKQVRLLTDRPDAALLLFGAVLVVCRKSGCREATMSLRMLNGVEHDCSPAADAFAARTQLELLGVRLPLDAALAWFPVHKLAITGDLRTTSEDAIVIDF